MYSSPLMTAKYTYLLLGVHCSHYHKLFIVHGFKNWVKVQNTVTKCSSTQDSISKLERCLSCKLLEDGTMGRYHICFYSSCILSYMHVVRV